MESEPLVSGEARGRRSSRAVALALAAASLLLLPPAALGQVTFSGPHNFPAATGPGPGPRGPSPTSVVVGDFNGDADPDLAVADSAFDRVSVLLGAVDATFGGPTSYDVGMPRQAFPRHAPQSVALGDFNGDSDPDLAVANALSNDVSVLLGGSGGTFGEATRLPAGRGPESVAVGDFNGDADPDLAVESSNDVSVLLGGAGGSFGTATSFPVGGFAQSVAVGDFNGDSDPDLAVAKSIPGTTDAVAVLLGGPGGSFGVASDYPVGDFPRSVAIDDFNGDSDPDLAVANDDSDDISVLLGAAGGGFSPTTTLPAGGVSPRSVAVGDFNGDSDPDLAVVVSHSVAVLLGGVGGSFGSPTGFPVGTSPASVAVGDFNLDAHPDLVSANSASSDVSVLVNETNFPPRGADDSYRALEGTELAVGAPGVLANDGDPEGDQLRAVLASPPGQGALALQPDGSFRYRPRPGFTGEDSFSYRADDGRGASGPATVRLSVAPSGVRPGPPPLPSCDGERATAIGTEQGDAIRGTPRRDVIVALGGNDTIAGLAGGDVVCGGAGNDRLLGGSGRDLLLGGSGNDRLSGGRDGDRLLGGPGKDRIDARDGRGGDRIACGLGRDSVVADRGDRVARDCERLSGRG